MQETKPWTPEVETKLVNYLKTHSLHTGKGTAQAPCSVQAINIALHGKPIEKVPECMSHTIGTWIVIAQDSMPYDIRNSQEWKELLPLAAGTGRDLERERIKIIMEWMWDKALVQILDAPHIQNSNRQDFMDSWKRMLNERTRESAQAAAKASIQKPRFERSSYVYEAACEVTSAIWYQEIQMSGAVWAATKAAHMASRASDNRAEFWNKAEPAQLLRSLVELKWSDESDKEEAKR